MSWHYQVRHKSNSLKSFVVFSNRLEFQGEIVHIYATILSILHCQAELNNLKIQLSY